MHADWQSLITVAIGLVAAIYLARRWWPGLRSLFVGMQGDSPQAAACDAPHSSSRAGSCGSGCGNCGHQTTPNKDHRIQVIRTRQG